MAVQVSVLGRQGRLDRQGRICCSDAILASVGHRQSAMGCEVKVRVLDTIFVQDQSKFSLCLRAAM